MCNCGLKVKLKIFIILHPHAHDVTGRLGRLGGDELYAANTLGLGKYLDTAPGQARPRHQPLTSPLSLE